MVAKLRMMQIWILETLRNISSVPENRKEDCLKNDIIAMTGEDDVILVKATAWQF